MTIKDRLQEFVDAIKIKDNVFEESIGASNAWLRKSGDTIRKNRLNLIREKYSQLNINWLLTGEGEMLSKEEEVFDVAEAVREIKAVTEVSLSALAQIIAHLNGKVLSDSVKKSLEDEVNALLRKGKRKPKDEG